MKLEQVLYEPSRKSEQKSYKTSDLTYMSATALYTSSDHGPAVRMPVGRNGGLTIRPLGQTQLHIHEGAGGTAHIKYKDGTRTPIGGYDAAMMDLSLDLAADKAMGRIRTKDKCKRKGRT